MLTINKGTIPQLIFDITSENESTQKMEIYEGLLDSAVKSSINPIFDNEVIEFKPDNSTVNYSLFFSSYKNMDWFNQVKPHTEETFTFHLNDSFTILSEDAKRTITNPKTFLQSNGIPVPKALFHFNKNNELVYDESPYLVLDPVEFLTNLTPTKEGVPIFYNTFALPFSKKIDKWGTDLLGFSNKTFLYNSFLLLDFYTSDDVLTQKKVMSVPVYVNGRYMAYEESVTSGKQIRPVFLLDNATEGYSLIWLKKFKFDKLYAKFSFWDALNGEQVTMIPSSKNSGTKKWVQNPNTFKVNNLYLEYSLNYETKKYKIREYNDITSAYDIESSSFDMYQLVYDEYFSKLTRIENTKPVNDVESNDIIVSDIPLSLTKTTLSQILDTKFNDTVPAFNHIASKYSHKNKSMLGEALYSVFNNSDVQLKDKALSYFERRFDDVSIYKQLLGELVIKNTTDTDLIIKKIEIKNVSVDNKNSFMQGNAIISNKFSRTPVTTSESGYVCTTLFSFAGSSFYKKVTPVKRPYDALQTSIYNKQAELYDNYYFDEANNKVVERPKEDISKLLDQIPKPKKPGFFKKILFGGLANITYSIANKKYNANIKGLTMNEKDLNLLLRSDVLEKSGTTQGYGLLFPVTKEKLIHKTDEYRDYGVTIQTKLGPQMEEFTKDSSLTLNSEMIFGKNFFKLFIGTNDEIVFKYDIVINFIDSNDKAYQKIIPCTLKYL